jgi:hypothetical protein
MIINQAKRRHDYPVLSFAYRSETLTLLPDIPTHRSTTVLLEFPVPIVERTHLARLEPPGDAVEVESVLGVKCCQFLSVVQVTWQWVVSTYVTDAPSHCALLARGRGLVGLALYAC